MNNDRKVCVVTLHSMNVAVKYFLGGKWINCIPAFVRVLEMLDLVHFRFIQL